MDRGQETTEMTKDSKGSSPSAAGESNLETQRLLQARERNDRNRDHLSTAFRVYKQLYGEEAAREAFIEIAANIVQDDDGADGQAIPLGISKDDSASSTTVSVDGQCAPKYLSYRQSLANQKDRLLDSNSQHESSKDNSSTIPASNTQSTSPASAFETTSLAVDANPGNTTNDGLGGKNTSIEPFRDARNIELVDTSSSDNLFPPISFQAADSDVTAYAPPRSELTDPPRYIRYRASLASRSPVSSLHGESTSLRGDQKQIPSSLPSAVAIPETLIPLEAEATSSGNALMKMASLVPRYVKYRAALSTRGSGDLSSANVNQSPSTSQIQTNPTPSGIPTASEDAATKESNKRQLPNATDEWTDDEAANFAAFEMNRMRGQPDMDDTGSLPSMPSISSQRYIAYRATLKDKPWSANFDQAPLLLSTSSDIVNRSVDAESPVESSEMENEDADFRSSPTTLAQNANSVRVGANAASILSDLKSPGQASPIAGEDHHTLFSVSTETSSTKARSVAEQLLRSSSGSEDDHQSDDGLKSDDAMTADISMANSCADHSAATPIISNSIHRKKQRVALSGQPASAYLSYESASSFESGESNSEPSNLKYMANVPSVSSNERFIAAAVLSATVSSSSSFDTENEETGNGEANALLIPETVDNEPTHDTNSTTRLLDVSAMEDDDDESSGEGIVPSNALISGVRSESSDSVASSSDSSSSSNSSSSSSAPITPEIVGASLNKSQVSELSGSDDSRLLNSEDYIRNPKKSSLKNTGSYNANPIDENKHKSLYTIDPNYSDSDDDPDPEVASVDVTAQRSQAPADPPTKKVSPCRYRKSICCALILFLMIAIPLSIWAGITFGQNENPSHSPNQKPSPTLSKPVSNGPVQSPINIPAAPVDPTKEPTLPTLSPTVFIPETPPPVVVNRTTAPTQQPIITPNSLMQLLSEASTDNGTALNTPGTPQSEAYNWLYNDPGLLNYTESRVLQRYALTTFFYSTQGSNWTSQAGWATYTDECQWFSRSSRIESCDEDQEYRNLDLGFNEVSGTIPPEIGMLTRLSRVIVSGGIRRTITGPLPTEIGLLTRMETFLLQGNSILGNIPSEIGVWRGVETIDLSLNNLGGPIPSDFGRMLSIRFLDLKSNRLSGTLPSTLDQLSNLERLSLSNNLLTGPMPTNIEVLTNLKVINLETNNITAISPNIGSMAQLETLTLNDNKIVGTLPFGLGNLSLLRRLDLNTNLFSGSIPTSIGNITTLRYLDLSSNNLNGPIPTELGQLSDILTLQLELNQLEGTIPVEFGSLALASLIRLDNNNLNGTVPEEVCSTFETAFPTFFVDCGGGINAEVGCREFCCSFCCTDGVGCACMYQNTSLDFLCDRGQY